MAQIITPLLRLSALALVLVLGWGRSACADDAVPADATDPLALQSAPVEKAATAANLKMFVEGALGEADRRQGLGSRGTGRVSLDGFYAGTLGAGLGATLSARLDNVHPASLGGDATVLSLREAYLSWHLNEGSTILDFGRINQRSGPGYGYNPTDFFRDGSLRVITSADPVVLRLNRLGTVMVRGQTLWTGGSLSIAYSPKITSLPSADGWSADFGATNNRNRLLVTLSTSLNPSTNLQALLYKDSSLSPTIGLNMSTLLSDAATGYFEWSHGREPDLQGRTLGLPGNLVTGSRLVAGGTYTTSFKTSFTAEYQYNRFGLSGAGFRQLAATSGAQLAYVGEGLKLQDLAARQSVLLYVAQKDFITKDLDLTAYLQVNPADHSKLAWLELRRHWSKFDLTLQYQQNIGRSGSLFGTLPDRRLWQILGTYYF